MLRRCFVASLLRCFVFVFGDNDDDDDDDDERRRTANSERRRRRTTAGQWHLRRCNLDGSGTKRIRGGDGSAAFAGECVVRTMQSFIGQAWSLGNSAREHSRTWPLWSETSPKRWLGAVDESRGPEGGGSAERLRGLSEGRSFVRSSSLFALCFCFVFVCVRLFFVDLHGLTPK